MIILLHRKAESKRKLDRELYIRELARMGLLHIEVNGMATPMGF